MIRFDTDDPLVVKARLTLAIEQGPVHLRALIRAVRDHGLGLLIVEQGKGAFSAPPDQPFVVIIGDDPLGPSRGPGAFNKRSLRKFAEGAKAAAVVACEPVSTIYDCAAGLALANRAIGLSGHVLIVETRPEHEIEWTHYVQARAPDAALLLGTTEDGAGHA